MAVNYAPQDSRGGERQEVPVLRFRLNMDTLLGIVLPYLIFVAIAANAVLLRFGFNYLYAVLMAMGIGAMLMDGLRITGIRNNALFLAYVVSILAMAFLHLLIFDEASVTTTVLIYIFVPAYWFVYFCKYDYRYLIRLTDLSVPIVYVIGFLGVVQFFRSPDLYGLIEVKSKAMDWAADSTFDAYSAFFRATSTLGSPQVYGLFMALSIVLILGSGGGTAFRWPGLGFLTFAGLLSGNKSFVAILAIYFLARIATRLRREILKPSLGILALVLLGYGVVKISESLPILERLASIEQMVAQEGGDSRISRYEFIISNTDPLLGNGIGGLTNRSSEGIRAAESYILKIYFEMGLLVTMVFLIFLAGAFFNSSRSKIEGIRIMIILIFFSMIIVHAFESPAFFLFWGILFSTFGVLPAGRPYSGHGISMCAVDRRWE